MNIYSESIQGLLTTDAIIYYFADGKTKPQRLSRHEAAPMKPHSSHWEGELQADLWSKGVFPSEFPNSVFSADSLRCY